MLFSFKLQRHPQQTATENDHLTCWQTKIELYDNCHCLSDLCSQPRQQVIITEE